MSERAAVNAGTRRFLDLCREEGLRLMVGDVHYFAHWITPRGAPRRFDTRFFVAAAPPGPAGGPRCGRDHRRDLDFAPPRPGGPPARRLRVDLPDHPQPAGHQPIRQRRRSARGGRPGLGRGADDRTAGGGRRQRGADRPARGRRVRRERPGRGLRGRPRPPGNFNEAVRAVSLAANRGGTAEPVRDPRRCRTPASARHRCRADRTNWLPGLLRLTAPNPGLMTGPGTNTYLLGAGSGRSNLAVVDPGPDDDSASGRHPGGAVDARGTLRWILVTHTHPDHAPGAAALARADRGARSSASGRPRGSPPTSVWATAGR